ncbi:MAG: LacI family transcriptional regulator [Phycisphaeraceae bacterium]|nr:MAG: LacI family transcriptional regulator [Phycisphaeraceae bacterium]
MTLANVAKLAGVAESTASRVLNGYTRNFRVRPEVRQRVLDAARDLKYKPNPMVRSISAKRTNLIAVVGWASDGVNRTAISSAVRLCKAAGKHVCTTFLQPDNAGHELPSWRVDGALALQVRQEQDVEELEAHGMPYVSINGLSGPGGDSVSFHEANGMEQAVAHLADLGHKKIGYLYLEQARVNPRGLPHGSVAARRDGYLDSLERRGLAPMPGWDRFEVTFDTYIRESVVGEGATAIVVYDDVMALYAIQAAHRFGIRVPEDLSIVAFNDELPARMATPPLTTVALPAATAGSKAAELLLERLSAEEDDTIPTRNVVLDEKLVVRQSTAPPPRK